MNRLGIKANMPDILASLLSNQIKDVYKNLKLREKKPIIITINYLLDQA